MPTAVEIIQPYLAKHGGLKGNAYPIDPTIKTTNPRTGEVTEEQNPDPTYHYEFEDGTSLEMNGAGQIKTSTEATPKATGDRQNYRSTKINGVTYESWDGHPWAPAQGLPSDTKTPTPADKLEIIKDPTSGKPVKLRDPATGTVIDLPDATVQKPSIVQGAGGAIYSWDGTKLTLQQAGNPVDAKPTNGQTRRVLSGDYVVTETYQNGVWSVDPNTPATRFVPTDKPKEGDVRPATDNKGQAIQEIYRGGSWTTDTSVPPKPFGNQAPTTISAPAGQEFIVQQPAGGGPTTNIPNPNYQAADVAGRVRQLQQQAQAKRDELNGKVQAGGLTKDQAAAEFDAWWSTTIDPQTQQLQQAQQQSQFDATIKQNQEQRAQAEAERSAFGTAQTAGTNAVEAAKAQMPYMVGPGFGAAVNQIAGAYASGKPAGNLDIGSAVTFDMPDFSKIAQSATAAALAHLSPTAAGLAGKPMPGIPQGVDIGSALNRSNYRPGTTTIAPDGTVTIAHTQPEPAMPDYRPPQLAPALGPPSGPLMG